MKQARDPLQLVLNKAEKEQQATSKKLQRMRIFIEGERGQEQALREYQQEYLQKIRDKREFPVDELNRYRGFFYQLEQALEQQQEKINLAEKQAEELQKSLIQQQHRINILKEVMEKQRILQQLSDDKQQQKIVDELAVRRLSFYQHSPHSEY